MSKSVRDPVSLEVFLAELSDEAAGAARVAANKMDDLERTVDDVRDIESRYGWVAALAGLAFVLGAVIVFYPSELVQPISDALGPFVITMMVISLGLVGLAYGFVVRRRSAVDATKQDLNREHFVPHKAYYFPPESQRDRGRVVFFEPRKLKAVRVGPHDDVRPGSSWW